MTNDRPYRPWDQSRQTPPAGFSYPDPDDDSMLEFDGEGADDAVLTEVASGRISALAALITAMKGISGQEEAVAALCKDAIGWAAIPKTVDQDPETPVDTHAPKE